MTPELKDKWVHALRSGNFKQGTSYLHNMTNDTYCCLGVLCAISPDVAVGRMVENDIRKAEAFGYVNTGDFYNQMLTTQLQNHFGLSEGQCVTLAQMNDGGKTFAQIADVIETKIPDSIIVKVDET